MLNNSAVYKYETPYKVLFVIYQCFNNGTITLKHGAIQIRHNIRLIKPYKYDTNVEYITPENMYDDINI